jgi:hypothetical protein
MATRATNSAHGAIRPRSRERLRDFGRAVTYQIGGLPIAVRAGLNRHPATPEAVVRRAYARQFWHPHTLSEIGALCVALLIWPFALAGMGVAFLFKNGRIVAERSNRSVPRQMLDQLRLYAAAGVLPPWYYIFELHRRPLKSHARGFIYRWESKAGVMRLLKEGGRQPLSAVNDKAEFFEHCQAHQVAAAPVLAVIREGTIEQHAHPAELDTDLFVKPVCGRGGKGAERWDRTGADRYQNSQGEELGREELFARLQRRSLKTPLLVQTRLRNHPALAPLNNDALSTVRVLTCLNEAGEPEVVGAALRMAIGGNHVVDNLHAGGIAAAVDIESGRLGSASNLGADCGLGWIERHPDSKAPVTGVALPMWDEVQSLAIRAHKAFADRVLVGWDIAITPDGPVVVEANGAPDLDIMQRFVRHGLMAARLGILLAFHVSQLGADGLSAIS